MLGEPVGAWALRRRLSARGSAKAHRLVYPDTAPSSGPVVDAGYAVRPAVVAALVSHDPEDAAQMLRAELIRPHAVDLAPSEATETDRLEALVQAGTDSVVTLAGHGDSGWFHRIAAGTDLTLLHADLRRIVHGTDVGDAVTDWATLAAVLDAALLVTGSAGLEARQLNEAADAIETAADVVKLIAIEDSLSQHLTRPRAVPFARPRLSASERAMLWQQAARELGLTLSHAAAQTLGASVRIDARQIRDCVERCSREPRSPGMSIGDQLRRAASEAVGGSLPPAARPVETVFTWDDLILPAELKERMRSISSHVTFSGRVLEEWGFSARLPYGQGVAALFSGPSGTGKTMAAQIIAVDLGKRLFQVDLSQTFSKYIGETEKNIDLVFDAAEDHGAVLLFDEADALFGKRAEVKDAHDRYANVEVAYLLQRMEAFSGVAILTSNMKKNIDQAFLRRLRFVVDFPLPDATNREAIWRRSFPQGAPLAEDVDLVFLARRLKLTGGNIQQIAIHAAFDAASEPSNIEMRHVVAATRRELLKLGMFTADESLDELALQERIA
jgi:hypothetical protein